MITFRPPEEAYILSFYDLAAKELDHGFHGLQGAKYRAKDRDTLDARHPVPILYVEPLLKGVLTESTFTVQSHAVPRSHGVQEIEHLLARFSGVLDRLVHGRFDVADYCSEGRLIEKVELLRCQCCYLVHALDVSGRIFAITRTLTHFYRACIV